MGANSKQGWYLFLFLIGFTFLMAGAAYLGAICAIFGAVCLLVASVGMYRIKPLEHMQEPGEPEIISAPPVKQQGRAAS